MPIGPTRELAATDPDQVELVTHGGDHVRAWNVDPPAFEERLADFLG